MKKCTSFHNNLADTVLQKNRLCIYRLSEQCQVSSTYTNNYVGSQNISAFSNSFKTSLNVQEQVCICTFPAPYKKVLIVRSIPEIYTLREVRTCFFKALKIYQHFQGCLASINTEFGCKNKLRNLHTEMCLSWCSPASHLNSIILFKL